MHTQFLNVQKSYDPDFVLQIPELEIRAGQRVGLVGNNGAGKTTLLRILLGLIRFDRGDVLVDGESVRSFDLSWRSKVASYTSEASLLPFLNPWEFWEFVGTAYGIGRQDVAKRWREHEGFVELAVGAGRRKRYIRDYSEGNRKKIGLVAAVMVRPRLLVLDEPFAHLDPCSRHELEGMLLGLNAEHGTTIIFSSHDLEHVVEVAGRILLLERGRIAFDGASRRDTLRHVRDRLRSRTTRPVTP